MLLNTIHTLLSALIHTLHVHLCLICQSDKMTIMNIRMIKTIHALTTIKILRTFILAFSI